MSFDDKIKSAALPSARFPVCLNHDTARAFFEADSNLQQIKREAEANPTAGDTRRGISPTKKAEKAREAAFEKFQSEAMWFNVTAVPSQRWSELLLANPPVEGNKTHEQLGYDPAAFTRAAFEECAKYVDGDTEVPLGPDQWAQFWAFVDDGLFDYIAQRVTRVNRQAGQADAAFLEVASTQTQR